MRRTVVALLAVIGLIAGASTAMATDAPTRQDPGTFPTS